MRSEAKKAAFRTMDMSFYGLIHNPTANNRVTASKRLTNRDLGGFYGFGYRLVETETEIKG
jgi:hypothetical protein